MQVQNSKLKVKSYSSKSKILRVLNFAFCVTILHFALCTLHLPQAYAEGTSLKMQPATLQIRATPPADIHAPFTIENPGDDPIDLTIIFKHFRDQGDGSGQVVYSNPQLTSDTDSFLKTVQVVENNIGVRNLTLGPKQKRKLDLEIVALNPEDTQDQYFSIVFLTHPQTSTNGNQDDSFSTVQSGIAIPVLVSFSQTGEKSTSINNFSAPLLVQQGPVPFDIQVKNNGSHFTTIKGVLFIKNMFGQTVGKIEINPTNILSDSTRTLSATQLENMPASRDPKSEVMWSEKLLFGFYTATLTVAILPDQILYTKSIHFFAVPAVGIVVIVVAVIIGISLIIRIKKKVSQE